MSETEDTNQNINLLNYHTTMPHHENKAGGNVEYH